MLQRRGFFALALLLVSWGVPAFAASSFSPSPPSLGIAQVDSAWKERLPRDPVLATQAYLSRLSPEALARSNSYFEGGYWLQLWGFLWSWGVALLLMSTGLSRWTRDRVAEGIRFAPFRLGIYAALYVAAAFALSLPLAIYQGFFREHQYGLANQSFWPWMGDEAKILALQVLIASPLIALVYGAIRRSPKNWHVWGAFATITLLIFATFVEPLWIDPFFNRYQPLEAGPVRSSILSLARANGIPASEVYEFDASRQTDRISANVAGIFGTASVRLNDNLLKRCGLAEVRAVMGHEMGHYVLNHIYRIILEFSIVVVFGFAFVRFGMERLHGRWGLRGAGDEAGLPLLIALMITYFFLMTPVTNTLIRVTEEEADIFGLNAAAEPDGFAEVALKLTEYRKPDPGALEEFVFFDHPSARHRIFSAMRWKAENSK